jgi:hypothetical protein
MARISIETLVMGKWLLLAAEADPEEGPVHGMKLVFYDAAGALRGAIVNWVTGAEIPLARIHLDGSTLELQMEPDEPRRAALKGETPTLVMKLVDDHFEGHWMNSIGEKLGGPRVPKLKMVPYQK